jgi:hypothetical protein
MQGIVPFLRRGSSVAPSLVRFVCRSRFFWRASRAADQSGYRRRMKGVSKATRLFPRRETTFGREAAFGCLKRFTSRQPRRQAGPGPARSAEATNLSAKSSRRMAKISLDGKRGLVAMRGRASRLPSDQSRAGGSCSGVRPPSLDVCRWIESERREAWCRVRSMAFSASF